jgi:hypothetical protein
MKAQLFFISVESVGKLLVLQLRFKDINSQLIIEYCNNIKAKLIYKNSEKLINKF